MSISAAQKRAIEEVIKTLCGVTKGRRKLCEMFMDLPDKETWPEYYKVIPEPRCLEGIRLDVERGKYKSARSVHDDLSLVFANALHYNERDSQIAKDASILKNTLHEAWKVTQGLPSFSSTDQKQTGETTTPIATSKKPMSTNPTTKVSSSPHLPFTNTMDDRDEIDGFPEELQEIEPESNTWESAARDEESSEIVRQLERGLPRWTGGNDKGWLEELPGDHQAKFSEILHLLKTYQTPLKEIPWQSLQVVPETGIKNVSYLNPLSCGIIEDRVQSKFYTTPRHFDQDFCHLFEGARRWHVAGSHGYGLCLLLQRLYQFLTSPPYAGSIPPANSNFSSITAGPGIARPIHSQTGESSHAVTTFRIPTKDRTFTDELNYKGWTASMGDWVHLMNPDDPAKPIIGQVFKTWVPSGEGAKAQQGLTVCWYFRPEQTYHSAQRQFWENEVFKTGHFADHIAEDIIEKIACQFTAKHIRGRPRPPYWYPGWPLYVCDSRYNDRERVFVKIKNWNSCIPEEFRKNDFMPIYPFERIIYPKLYQSPFLSGVKGPGQLIEGKPEKVEADKPNSENAFRRRTRKSTQNAGSLSTGPSITGNTQANEPSVALSAYPPTVTGSTINDSNQLKDKSVLSVVGVNSNVAVEVLPGETVKHFDRDPETNQVLWFSGPPIDVARTPAPRHSLTYLHYLAVQKKRKQGDSDTSALVNGSIHTPAVAKRRITEQLNEVWTEVTEGNQK